MSPIIANIVLNELDSFIEDEIIPEYTMGKSRQYNMEYINLASREQRARKRGDWKEAKRLRKIYTKLPSRIPNDPNFKRLKYVRYADDFLLGLIGTKADAIAIKKRIKNFLKGIDLELSEGKTLITNARNGKARFLNYHINLMTSENKVKVIRNHGKMGTHKRRVANHKLYFSIPYDVTKSWLQRVQKGDRSFHRRELLNLGDYNIISTYEIELQGMINYYSRIHNLQQLRHLRYKWERSLIKTLAAKHRTKMQTIRRRYARFRTATASKLIGVQIQRGNKKPLIAVFGRKPIQRQIGTVIKDIIQTIYVKRNELINRLLAETCELCGVTNVAVEGHHIRKLKDLKKKWHGKVKPKWVMKMIAITRKTLFVCKTCHQQIHAGLYDGRRLAHVLLESSVIGNQDAGLAMSANNSASAGHSPYRDIFIFSR